MKIYETIKSIIEEELCDDELLEVLKEFPKLFKFIPNPSEELKATAVLYDATNISYIDNPSTEIQLISVRMDYENIKYIDKLDPKVEILAMENLPDVFRYIKNPSEKSKDIACMNGDLFKFIKNPSEEQCVQAVKTLDSNVKYIDKPSIEVQRLLSYDKLNFVNEIDSSLLFEAIDNNPFIVTKIDYNKLSENHIRYAINCDPSVFIYLRKEIQEKYFQQVVNCLKTKIKTELCLDFITEKDIIRMTKSDPIYILLLLIDDIIISDYISDVENVCMHNPEYASIFWKVISDDMKTMLLSTYGWLIENIDKPSLEQELIAVMNSADSIQYIKDPSNFCQMRVMNRSPYLFKNINNPTDDTIILALSKNPSNIRLVKNPSEFLTLKSIRKDPTIIQFFDEQTSKMQQIAYLNNKSSAIYFKNITDNELKKNIIKDNINLLKLDEYQNLDNDLISDIYMYNPEVLLYLSVDRMIAYIDYIETSK